MSRKPMTIEEAAEAVAGVSLDRRVACVRRELALREVNYPRWIANGTMKQAVADDEIRAMRAVLGTLELLAAGGFARQPQMVVESPGTGEP